jgi:hypothetical protein
MPHRDALGVERDQAVRTGQKAQRAGYIDRVVAQHIGRDREIVNGIMAYPSFP